MNRRTLMKSAASSAVGACLLGGMTDNAMNAHAASLPAKSHTGDTGRPAAALIPKAQLRVYEGAPHGLFLTHKDRLNADLRGFIRG